MAEYIEREALMKDIGETVLFSVRGGAKLPTPEMRGANKVKDRIKSAPAADVVEVVRCKDCKHHLEGVCYNLHHIYTLVEPNHYCGYGAKMDGKGDSK